MTDEQKVYGALSQSNYNINIKGQNLSFRYATLDDLQKISALVSQLPKLNEIGKDDNINADIPQLIESFGCAGILSDIILVTANSEVTEGNIFQRWYKSILEKNKVKKLIKRGLNIIEVYITVQQIFKENHVFFYQDTITFLKGMNMLKPTKETDQTVHS